MDTAEDVIVQFVEHEMHYPPPKVVLAEGRLGEYGPGFLRAGFCLPRLVFRPKLQHGQLRGRRQNPGVSTLFSKIIQAGFLRGPLLHAESQESAFRV
jgi:hypothetical protein